ncbi:MAG: hypothetical protein ACYCS8_05995 [Acidithiobacillus sp.]
MIDQSPAPHQLADLFDGFFIGDGQDDLAYIDGLIRTTNKGNVATLYARSAGQSYGLSRKKLDQVVGKWNIEADNPFHYSMRPLPQSLVEKLSGTVHQGSDQLVTIIGMDLRALTREVHFAQEVLSAFGLRPIGPEDPRKETEYHIATQKLVASVRKTAEESSVESSASASYLPVSSKGSLKSSRSLEHRHETSSTLETDDVLPVGAAREWLFMKAIAVAAGVPEQPNDCMNLYRQTLDDKDPQNGFNSLWAVFEHTKAAETRADPVNKILYDAERIRTFLTDKLLQMESRFESMATSYPAWGTRLSVALDPENGVDLYEAETRRDASLFKDIAAATHALTAQASGSLSSNSKDDLFKRLQTLAGHCAAMGGIEWAAKDFKTLAYTANLLNIVERHAMFFQQETVNRIQNGNSVLPDDVLSVMKSAPIEIHHGYGFRAEGELVKPGQLPGGFSGEFPCVKTKRGFVMVPGAKIEEDPETGLSVLSTPNIPDYPKWLMPNVHEGEPLSDSENREHPASDITANITSVADTENLRALRAALSLVQTAYANAATDPGLSRMESFAAGKRAEDVVRLRDKIGNPTSTEEIRYGVHQAFDAMGMKIMMAGGLSPEFIVMQKDRIEKLMEADNLDNDGLQASALPNEAAQLDCNAKESRLDHVR